LLVADVLLLFLSLGVVYLSSKTMIRLIKEKKLKHSSTSLSQR
jgi:hypothetical protein